MLIGFFLQRIFIYLTHKFVYSVFEVKNVVKEEEIIMEDKKIRRNLYRVLRKTGVEKKQIQPQASYKRDLNFDSVDWQIFTFYLEGIFDISLPDEEIPKLGSVNDTLQFLKQTA